MNRKKRWLPLLAALLLLTGCAGEKEQTVQPEQTREAAAQPQAEGPLGSAVRTMMSAYGQELEQVSLRSGSNMTYTIPGDMLNQLARDAEETGAAPQQGRYRFVWRQSGNYTYEATADDHAPLTSPDPRDEAPMDSQLNGDYAVSGGGFFDRVRAYDVAEDLSGGSIEIVDTLDGSTTGHEAFSFAMQGKNLVFVDAVLDLSSDEDGLTIRQGYLAAAGVIRPDGLDIMEYAIDDLSQLPDPGSLNVERLAADTALISRLTAKGEEVTVFSP